MKYISLFPVLLLFFISCQHQVEKKRTSNTMFIKAYDYRDRGMPDSAFYCFNKAKDVFFQQKDSLGAGKCLVNMGIISTDKGDYYGAQEIALNAISCFDLKDKAQYVYLSSNYNNLGIATHNLEDYAAALKFFDKAIKFSTDSSGTLVYLNNKARTYQVLKNYDIALKLYSQVLKSTRSEGKEYARVLTNITYAKWLRNSKYNVIPYYLKALRLRIKEKDLWGQNSSYSHLSEYYAKENPDSALFYATKQYIIAKQLNSSYDQMEALRQLIKFSPVKASKQYFENYQQLNDSVQTSKQIAKTQFALIRYETEKHKTDFLKAQAENIQKRNNILVQNFVLGVLVLCLISGILWYRKRKKILQQEKALEVKNTELKYVKKIHDRVANKVYHVMSEVENNPGLHKDVLLDKLEDLYNISRDISYENDEVIRKDSYAAQLSQMLQSYSAENTEVLIVGNEEELWSQISSNTRDELFYVLQELMTNMSKHSQASTVVLKFQGNNPLMSIVYLDNGVGMQGVSPKNGLTNTENRIKSINGTLNFDSKPEEGLAIYLSIPFSSR